MIKMLEIYNEHWYYDTEKLKFELENNLPITICASGSTIPSCFAKSKFIQISENTKGLDEHREWFKELANDGTAEHAILNHYLTNNCTIEPALIKSILLENAVKSDKINKLTKAFLSFRKFFIDYNVVPILCEQSFVNYELQIGGTRDLVCEMDNPFQKVKKGETRERIKALVDYKTGSYSEIPRDYKYQLNLYNLDLKENPEFADCKMIIVCPKQWRTEPGFNLFEIEEMPKERLLFAIDEFYARSTTRADVTKEIYDFTKLKTIDNTTDFCLLKNTELNRLLGKK
ncbi:MAG: hypothetical protein ABFC34_13875 [Methanobacterium sp.]